MTRAKFLSSVPGALLAGIAAPLAVVAALIPVRTSFAAPAAALVLVAVVTAVAVAGNRLAGAVAAVSAAVWFDFFLTVPYERFAISHRSDIETAVALLVVGLVVTELAARNRRHHGAAEERMDFVAVVYGLSELVAGGAPAEEVVERARLELTELLSLRSCCFEAGAGRPLPTRIEHNGELISGPAPAPERPAGEQVELTVERARRQLGRFVLVPGREWPPSAARLLTAIAVADQVATALAEDRRSA